MIDSSLIHKNNFKTFLPGRRLVNDAFDQCRLRYWDDGLDSLAVGSEDGDRPHAVSLGDDQAAPAGADVQLVVVHCHGGDLDF